jgi:hypothetical protein
MMDAVFPFGSRGYCISLLVLLLARGADFLSTWVASPNLVLEGNPISKRLGWLRAGVLNLAVSLLLAVWLLPAVIVATMSILLAARHFQFAWLMRTFGEQNYRDWWLQRLSQTPRALFVFSLVAQSAMMAVLGGALVFFNRLENAVITGIGMGIICYSLAVVLYTLNAAWRNRHVWN